MRNVRTIIFDFGGVILNIDYNKTSKAFNSLGVTGFDDMYSQKNADPLFRNLEEGKKSEEEFYTAFRKSTQLPLTDHQINTAWNKMLLGYRKEALHTLKSIKHKYSLFLLSNTNIIHLQAFNKIYKDEVG
ncbi:MAG TPA: HAD family phosphatase, partial [Chitinophagaceae bacterium]|nr:HAD family phosphatase [Chitinophagaceae bacterium]